MSARATSVFTRLKNRFRREGGEFETLLERYALERLLWRLSQSAHADRFVLKGAQLFALWAGAPHRPTRDADLLGYGEPSASRLKQIFEDLVRLPAMPDDGLVWDPARLDVAPIREETEYGGLRVRWEASLHSARIRVQVDVGFGDAVTPGTTRVDWPPLLDLPGPRLLAYPPETVIAEKLEAAVKLDLANTRMKDFFDLHWLATHRDFDLPTLARAVQATFDRRGTPLPMEAPTALTDRFSTDRDKQVQWQAFLRKAMVKAPPLPEVIAVLNAFLMPTLAFPRSGAPSSPILHWPPGGPWQSSP